MRWPNQDGIAPNWSLPALSRQIADGTSAGPARELRLSELAYRVGVWLAEHSENGLDDAIDGRAIVPDFEGVSVQDLTDAIAELEIDGYVSARSYGEDVPHITYRTELFSTFDPLVVGTDPTPDAAALGRLGLEMGESVSVPELHGKTDWSLRRFDPALSILIGLVDARRVSQSGDDQYATHFLTLMPTDRVAVRRFVERWLG